MKRGTPRAPCSTDCAPGICHRCDARRLTLPRVDDSHLLCADCSEVATAVLAVRMMPREYVIGLLCARCRAMIAQRMAAH
jgi:hypothetical protein